jgi:hypothetical protein
MDIHSSGTALFFRSDFDRSSLQPIESKSDQIIYKVPVIGSPFSKAFLEVYQDLWCSDLEIDLELRSEYEKRFLWTSTF